MPGLSGSSAWVITAKECGAESYSIDQIISAPFGDDPVLISQATITNHSDAAVTVRWVEYWGCQPYQFSFRAAIESMTGHRHADKAPPRSWQTIQPSRRRRSTEARACSNQSISTVDRLRKKLHGSVRRRVLRANPNGFTAPVADLRPGTDFESLDLPQTFLVSLDGPVSGFSSDAGCILRRRRSGKSQRLKAAPRRKA